MDTLRNLLSPLTMGTGTIQDTMVGPSIRQNLVLVHLFLGQKLVVIGGTVETARRVSISAWNGFIDCA